jgi:choline kinase
MIAILLSAGKGSRMYPLTANTPKCLIDIGQGKTVLESQLDVLQSCGFKKVIIVAGYRIEQVQAKISGYRDNGMKVEVIHNPFYNTSNNIISLWLALLVINEPCISINGDDVFKPIVINSLLESRGEIVMTIDKKDSYDADDMLVITEKEKIISVGKDLEIDRANGESVGIIKFETQGLNFIKETIDIMLRDEGNHQRFYLSVLQQIIDRGFPVTYCEVDQNDWAEIDFHPDVHDVRNRIDSFLTNMF